METCSVENIFDYLPTNGKWVPPSLCSHGTFGSLLQHHAPGAWQMRPCQLFDSGKIGAVPWVALRKAGTLDVWSNSFAP